MNKVMLLYPPGRAYQRSEDRAQCNIEDSAVASTHACNDIGYAAAVLLEKNYSVFLKDYQTELATKEQVKADIEEFRPDLIFISITNATIYEDLDFINWIKSFHDCKFVIKGAIFYNPKKSLLETLDLSNVSCLVGGEIEFIMGPVADYLLRNEGNPDDIPGIIYKNGNEFISTKFDCWNKNLDELPFPARHLMNNAIYTRPDTGEPMATISVAKGCPSNCIYCLTPIISGKNVRLRSVRNVFAEIEECYYKFNIRNFFFKADTFTIDNEWASALCDKIINSDLNGKIEFTANSRTKPLSFELLQKMKQAGCFMVAVGFETGSEKTMKLIKKGATLEDSIRATELIKKAGIPLFGFFMVGFPWETKEDIKATEKFILKLNPDFIEIHIAMPYYGTELYQYCVDYNTLSDLAWGNDYYAPNTIGTSTVSLEEVTKMKKKMQLKFYLRPIYILKTLKKCMTSFTQFKNYAQHAIKLLKKNLF